MFIIVKIVSPSNDVGVGMFGSAFGHVKTPGTLELFTGKLYENIEDAEKALTIEGEKVAVEQAKEVMKNKLKYPALHGAIDDVPEDAVVGATNLSIIELSMFKSMTVKKAEIDMEALKNEVENEK